MSRGISDRHLVVDTSPPFTYGLDFVVYKRINITLGLGRRCRTLAHVRRHGLCNAIEAIYEVLFALSEQNAAHLRGSRGLDNQLSFVGALNGRADILGDAEGFEFV